MTGPRQSFLVHVHAAEKGVLVLNIATRERVRVDGLPAIGPQIDRWLGAADGRPADSVGDERERT